VWDFFVVAHAGRITGSVIPRAWALSLSHPVLS